MIVVGLDAIDGKLLIIYISQTKHTSEKNGVIGEVDLPAMQRENARMRKRRIAACGICSGHAPLSDSTSLYQNVTIHFCAGRLSPES